MRARIFATVFGLIRLAVSISFCYRFSTMQHQTRWQMLLLSINDICNDKCH